jgi:uncharacterized protein YdhG (YjbR/CyaY superfamily)
MHRIWRNSGALAVWKRSPEEAEARPMSATKHRMPKRRMTGMKQSVPESVGEYMAAQPEAVRPKLEQVRAAIRRAVPDAVESIGYRVPGFKLHGKPIPYFAGFKEHSSLFAASGTFFAALEDELRGYELRKGTVHFPLTKPVPVKLISRIAKLRAAGGAATKKKPLLGREKERRKSARQEDGVAPGRATPQGSDLLAGPFLAGRGLHLSVSATPRSCGVPRGSPSRSPGSREWNPVFCPMKARTAREPRLWRLLAVNSVRGVLREPSVGIIRLAGRVRRRNQTLPLIASGFDQRI